MSVKTQDSVDSSHHKMQYPLAVFFFPQDIFDSSIATIIVAPVNVNSF